jgi:amidase
MAARSRRRPPQSPPGGFLEELNRERPLRMRIKFVRHSRLCPTDPEVADAFMRSVDVLAGLGHDIEESTLPDATVEEFLPLWQHQIGQIPFVRWSRAQPVTRWLGEAGRRLRARDVAARHAMLETRFTGVLATADVWATPTVALPPPLVGAFANLAPSAAIAAAAQLGAFTALANVMGYPAASVPMGLTRRGLPMGLQLLGGRHGDPDVLALSRQLELAMPWRQRHPPGLD